MAVNTKAKAAAPTPGRPEKVTMGLGEMRCMVLEGDVSEFAKNGWTVVGPYVEGKAVRNTPPAE